MADLSPIQANKKQLFMTYLRTTRTTFLLQDNYVASYAGGGSGGSILIRTKMFEGSGTVQVSYKQVYFYCDSSKLLEENGYEKRQTSMIKTTVLQFMLEAP